MSRWLQFIGPCLAAAALSLGSASTHAQAWPAKPIRLVVPYAAGGPGDVIARLVARKVGEGLQQTLIVDNKAGAGGTIGLDSALKSAPDGYTFALTAQGPLAGMPNLMKVPYALADVQYLTLVARGPSVIVVGKKVAANSLAELVKLAKASPGKLNYGSAGPGTTPHIGAELLKLEAGIDIAHVPYKGAAPAVTGLLGGEIEVAMVDLLVVLPHVAAGSLKVLAVASPSRAPQLPDVPTTSEAGYPKVVMDTVYGVVAPPGVPDDLQKRFREAIVAALQSPDLKAQMLKQGVVPLTTTPQDYRAMMQAEFDKWQRVVAQARIKLD
jgi:tripartite-type tricarboxylate transporter receptor subunit TctC